MAHVNYSAINRHPDLSPNIFRLPVDVIEGKPVSKTVLDIVIKLAGFDRGAVFLACKGKELKLAVSLGIKNDQKAVEFLIRRSSVTAPSPVEYTPDTTRLDWVRDAPPLRDSFILSYASVATSRVSKVNQPFPGQIKKPPLH